MCTIVKLFPDKCVHAPLKDDARMDIDAFRIDLVRPALKITDFWSYAAENLIVGTALAESNLDVVKQIGGGPALSFMQIEPATYLDVVKYVGRNSNIKEKILSACFMEIFPEASALTWHIRLSILIARMVYWRRPEPLPSSDDIAGLGAYWKEFYNTPKGKGTVEHFVKQWKAHHK